MLLLLMLIVPFIFALASLASGKKVWLLELLACVAAPIEFGSALAIASKVLSGGHYGYGPYLSVDALGVIVLLTVVTVNLAASFYSVGYMRQEFAEKTIGLRRMRQYYSLLHMFLFAMALAILSANPIVMWISIEATTLSTAFLISFYDKPSAMEAAWKYLIINSVGLLLAFFGTLLFFTSVSDLGASGIMDWQTLLANASHLNPLVAKIAFVFALIGYGTKVGLAPMHTWLPDAHSKAPSPISAMLSGSLLNIAFLAVLRCKTVADAAVGTDFSQKMLVLLGILSLLIAAFIILVQNNYKRLLAYSSIEHMGVMALGFGFGGLGSFAALLHMIYHSLAKSSLFLSSGNVFLKYGSTKIDKVKGLLSTMPVTAILLILGFLAITGTPPFGIFITEFNILSAGIASHPIAVVLSVVALAVVFIGFLRHVAAMVFGESPEMKKGMKGEGSLWMILPPLALVSILLVTSFFLPDSLNALIQSASDLIR